MELSLGTIFPFMRAEKKSYGTFCSFAVIWQDKRYINENEGRLSSCIVEWTKSYQFWVPNFFVLNVMELVNALFDYLSAIYDNSNLFLL